MLHQGWVFSKRGERTLERSILVLVLPLTCCVTSGRLLSLSDLQFFPSIKDILGIKRTRDLAPTLRETSLVSGSLLKHVVETPGRRVVSWASQGGLLEEGGLEKQEESESEGRLTMERRSGLRVVIMPLSARQTPLSAWGECGRRGSMPCLLLSPQHPAHDRHLVGARVMLAEKQVGSAVFPSPQPLPP